MWIVIARQPRLMVPVWPGRRLLACADVIAWPAGWIVGVANVPMDFGGWKVSSIIWPLLAIGVFLQIANLTVRKEGRLKSEEALEKLLEYLRACVQPEDEGTNPTAS